MGHKLDDHKHKQKHKRWSKQERKHIILSSNSM